MMLRYISFEFVPVKRYTLSLPVSHNDLLYDIRFLLMSSKAHCRLFARVLISASI